MPRPFTLTGLLTRLLPLWDTAPRTAGAPQPQAQLCFSPAHHPLMWVFMCMSVYRFSACPPPLGQRMSAGASRVAQHPRSTQDGGAQSQRGWSMVTLHTGPHSDATRRQVGWVCISRHTFLCCHSSQGCWQLRSPSVVWCMACCIEKADQDFPPDGVSPEPRALAQSTTVLVFLRDGRVDAHMPFPGTPSASMARQPRV